MRLALILSVLLSACVHGENPVPYEARVWLLDAQEDALAAAARSDEARDNAKRGEAYLSAVEERLSMLEPASADAKEVAAERELAIAALNLADRHVEHAERVQICAEQHLEAAQAEAAVRYQMEGADEGLQNALLAQAKACDGALAASKAQLADADEKAQKSKSKLERVRADLARADPLGHPQPYLQ